VAELAAISQARLHTQGPQNGSWDISQLATADGSIDWDAVISFEIAAAKTEAAEEETGRQSAAAAAEEAAAAAAEAAAANEKAAAGAYTRPLFSST